MKRFLHTLLLISLFVVFPFAAFAQPDASEDRVMLDAIRSFTVPVHTFVRDDCGHCIDMKAFFSELENERQDFTVIYYDIDETENRTLFDQIAELESLTKATPITIIGGKLVQGFEAGETTGQRFIELIEQTDESNSVTPQQYVEMGGSGSAELSGGTCDAEGCEVTYEPFYVKVPFYGPVDVKKYSLPVMALVLGFIDGFNPCAMWVLVTFLIVLVQIGDRKKMWQIAGLFIVAEAVMYYMILNVWFSAWDFIGLDRIITPIIGVVAIGGGIFFLYEWWTSDGTCKVTNLEQRKKIHGKIQEIASKPMTLAVAAGVIVLALSVNIIEFACSIGIPQAFTKIIELNQLGWLESQGLMLLYILMYMVDDFIVFGLALWGAQHLNMTSKYAKWCNFIGGVLMILLGALLIFAPNLLRF